MPIIAKPAIIQKGSDAIFTLDKTALSQISPIFDDNYFRDVNNWKEVRLVYRTAFGGKEDVIFDASNLNPQAPFNVSLRGRGLFEFDEIYIEDFDNGYFIVPNTTLGEIAEDFAVTIEMPPELKLSDWVALSKIFSLSEDYDGN